MVKRPGVLSKVQMLDLVLGVGVFSRLPSKGVWKTQERGKHTIRLLPKNSFGSMIRSPPPCVHALPFPLEDMGNDQTIPTFGGLQKWSWRVRSMVRFPPQSQNRELQFAPQAVAFQALMSS